MKQDLMTRHDVCKNLGISTATLDNWVRNAIPNAKINSTHYDITIVEEFIKTNNKLSTRANKKKSNTLQKDKMILSYLDADTKWVDLYTCYLETAQGDVARQIIDIYKNRLYGTSINVDKDLEEILPKNDLYVYSIAYQLLLTEGAKSEMGAFYTPKDIVQNEVNAYIQKDKLFLEPCCGCGFYVIEYIKSYINAYNVYPDGLIYAFDIDPLACEITKLNIEAVTQKNMKNFTVECRNGLELPYQNIFEIILTNPPYGLKNTYEGMVTTEIFSHFLDKCLNTYLKKEGILSFVLPKSILNVSKHNEIRKKLLNEFSILKIQEYGKKFSNVLSDVVTLTVQKNENKDNVIQVNDNSIKQTRFIENNYVFNDCEDSDYDTLAELMKKDHITLLEAEFHLGLVTGNNKKYTSPVKTIDFPNSVLTGKDIADGTLKNDQMFIFKDQSIFQQTPKSGAFLGPKIIYKFISKNIKVAIDYDNRYTLNSANIIKPNIPKLSIEYIAAMLNSELTQKILHMKFGNVDKILKSHIQNIPIFILDEKTRDIVKQNYKSGHHFENEMIIQKQIVQSDFLRNK
jgi:predicted RNA methylase